MAHGGQSGFGEKEQVDLFGAAPAAVARPDPRHVRNRLTALLSKMQASATWPWEPAVVRLHRERTFAYLCDLLPEPGEAEDWRQRIAAEAARLDAAA